MKKFLSTLLAAAMCISLAACGGNNSTPSTSGGGSASSGGSGSAGGSGSGYTGGSYSISLGHICSENHSLHLASLKFKDFVEEQSGGAITVDVHPNGVLGGDEAMLESVALGTLTMVVPSASVMNNYVDAFGILAMPYLFTNTDDAFAAVDGELGELLNQKLVDANVGLTNLGYNFNGIRNMTNKVRPIETPDDLKGLKMRCMSNEMFVTMFKLLGANATPMAWSELFTAMQQGTVDGEENPASLIYESKFQEVQKYLSTTEHIYDFCTICINTDFYNSLDDQAKAIVDSGNELMNHSNAHDHYNSLTADQIIADVNTCNDKIEALTGVRPTLIRCPFGEYDDHVISTIRSIGMEPIQWDVEALAAVGRRKSMKK